MTQAAREVFTTLTKTESPRNTTTKINDTHTEEIFFVLCGPIGTDIHYVGEVLKELIESKFDYDCKILKLSDYIRRGPNKFSQDAIEGEGSNKYKEYRFLINEGNKLREAYGSSVLAEYAINDIAYDRHEKIPETDKMPVFKTRRNCYIVDSIKNQEELEILRLVYRDLIYFIGVYSPLSVRQKNLEDKQLKMAEIFQLIDMDSGEEVAYGQKVTDTFTQADFFMRVESSTKSVIASKLERFLDLIFGTEVITPTTDETAMYLATSASSNSACLSRQVGAAITDSKGELISVGWNDVPKFGGNLYQPEQSDALGKRDKRCMNIEGGKCFNDVEKNIISQDMVDILLKNGLIAPEKKDLALKAVRSSKIKGLIEFSRSIHAEMHAIIIGSQSSGEKIRNGKLYCTTYPCHNCARHIIASGIKEVYYIEPYRKSLCIKLHSDAITEDENDQNKVRILLFDGVAPNRYMQLFKMHSSNRKESNGSGKKISLSQKASKPKWSLTLEAIPTLESLVTKTLKEKGALQNE